MAHTPGPWSVADHDSNGQRIVRNEHIEICTCWHHCVVAIEQEMEANARLIAAAPDLLAALEMQMRRIDVWADTPGAGGASDALLEVGRIARTAIAKAKGNS